MFVVRCSFTVLNAFHRKHDCVSSLCRRAVVDEVANTW